MAQRDVDNAIRWLAESAAHFVEDRDSILPQVNLVDIIAAHCGWKPLVVGETMTVTIGGKRYKIVREKDL